MKLSKSCTHIIAAVFKYNVVDHSDLDEDAEADDDPVLEEGQFVNLIND